MQSEASGDQARNQQRHVIVRNLAKVNSKPATRAETSPRAAWVRSRKVDLRWRFRVQFAV